MIYSLPTEIQTLIYEYDDTYKEYFSKHVLEDIKSIKIYKNVYNNNYILIDEKKNELAITNNICHPYYLVKYSNWSKQHIKQQLRKKILQPIFPNDKSHVKSIDIVNHRYSENMIHLQHIIF